MTNEEKNQMLDMQSDISSIKKDIHNFNQKFDKLFTALLGSEIGKDGGLVGRIDDLEKQVEKLVTENNELKKENTKRDLYLNIIWAIGGAIFTAIGLYVLNTIILKK